MLSVISVKYYSRDGYAAQDRLYQSDEPISAFSLTGRHEPAGTRCATEARSVGNLELRARASTNTRDRQTLRRARKGKAGSHVARRNLLEPGGQMKRALIALILALSCTAAFAVTCTSWWMMRPDGSSVLCTRCCEPGVGCSTTCN